MDGPLKKKTYQFALKIIELYQLHIEMHKEYVLSRQILKSGTSIGAQIYEGDYSESKADMLHKFRIALKEANESVYWLNLLKDSGYLDLRVFDNLSSQLNEIIKMLIASINTLRK